jgi:hypothetical protein
LAVCPVWLVSSSPDHTNRRGLSLCQPPRGGLRLRDGANSVFAVRAADETAHRARNIADAPARGVQAAGGGINWCLGFGESVVYGAISSAENKTF